jgi:hypothetical protein
VFDRGRDVGGFHDSLVGGFGPVVAFDGLGADALFGDEFCRGAEQVMEESPLMGVEVIEQGDGTGIIESLIAEPLTDMGPVFLFDVGVIVFVIGSASGELDGAFSLGKVSEEMVIEELRSVIAVKPKQGKGQRFFDMVDLFQDAGFSLSPDCPLFTPARGDIDTVNGVGKHPRQGGATVGNRIGLQKPRARFIPLVGLYGDMLFQESSWFGGGAACFLVPDSGRTQEPINGRRRDVDQGAVGLGRKWTELLHISRKPQGQQRFEAF